MKKVFFLILFSNYILFSQNISVTKSIVFNDLKANNKLERTLSLDDGSIMTIRSYSMSSANVYPTFRVSHYNSQFKLLDKTDFKHGNALIIGAFVKEEHIFLIEQRIVERFINNKTITGVRIFVLSSLISSLNFEEKELISLGNYNIHDYFKGYTKLYSTDEPGKVMKKYAHLYHSKNNNFFALVFDVKNKKIKNKGLISFTDKFEIAYTKVLKTDKLHKKFIFKDLIINDTNGNVFFLGHPLYKKPKYSFLNIKYLTELQVVSKDTIITSIIHSPNQSLSSLKLFHGSNGLSCTGIYTDVNNLNFYGVFRINFDDKNLTQKMTSFIKIEKHILKYIKWPYSSILNTENSFNGKQSHKKDKFIAKNSFHLDDGSIIFNIEKISIYSNSTPIPSPSFNSGGISVSVGFNNSTYINRGDLVSFKISNNGEMKWAKKIKKTDVSSKTIYKNGKVFFIMKLYKTQKYNEEILKVFGKKLGQSHLYSVTIDENGEMNSEKLIDKKDLEKHFAIDDGKYSKENNELIFLGSKKKSKKSQLIKLSINF